MQLLNKSKILVAFFINSLIKKDGKQKGTECGGRFAC